MRLADFYPARGTFAPGQAATLIAEVEADSPAQAAVRLSIAHLTATVASIMRLLSPIHGRQTIAFDWLPPLATRGYGAEVELLNEAGDAVDVASTAFDVLPRWTAFPRYGFLTDFSPGRADAAQTVELLSRFHLNGLQFYDWQYRHDCLLPPDANYMDLLGRPLSLRVVEEFIAAAHARGIAAMPYLAVYAASAEYWRAHLDDALCDSDGRPIPFGDNFLGLMNPAPGGRWARHLRDECGRALAALPFDGLHVDQYGDPKTAFDASGRAVDLPSAFASFVTALKTAYPQASVVFNAVGNWPIESLAASPQDFAYIEIWPPATRYRDVARIVAESRTLSGGKPVVIALYLPSDRPANIQLADAIIFACGGSRIELGERERLLADPYFPKHQPLTAELKTTLRRYYDFAVRYGDLIGPAAHDVPDCGVDTPAGVWAIARDSDGWLTVCLINTTGLGDAHWDAPHPPPASLAEVPIRVAARGRVREAWWTTPDLEQIRLSPLPIHTSADEISVTVPALHYWSIVALKLDSENQRYD